MEFPAVHTECNKERLYQKLLPLVLPKNNWRCESLWLPFLQYTNYCLSDTLYYGYVYKAQDQMTS